MYIYKLYKLMCVFLSHALSPPANIKRGTSLGLGTSFEDGGQGVRSGKGRQCRICLAFLSGIPRIC